jgi:uncharacterized membrane protein YfhO
LRVARTFDPNWKADVDGRPGLLRRDGAFTALDLPAGKSVVEMRYENSRLRAGAVLSALSLAAIIALMVRGRRAP